MIEGVVHLVLLLVAPPLLLGVINRVKAWFAGRRGQPLLQPYFDLARLFRKGAVYSHTTTWVFRAGPMVAWAGALLAGLLVPLLGERAPFGFEGDVIAFGALFGLGRFFTMAAALDTGSAFEGMGASREATFSAFAEPALLLALALLCVPTGSVSFAGALGTLSPETLLAHPTSLMAIVALFAVLLSENSRIPVDDPNTHLELTMIHEVMVLDHSGPDFALIQHGAAMKLFVTGALLVNVLIPRGALVPWGGALVTCLSLVALAGLVGVVESVTARLRLQRVPQFLIGASVVAAIGLAVLLSGRQP